MIQPRVGARSDTGTAGGEIRVAFHQSTTHGQQSTVTCQTPARYLPEN
jgi:hypothetical protein